MLRLGIWEHESDGEEGMGSSSWDRQYIQVKLFPADGRYNWNLDLKLWRLVDQRRPWEILLPWNYLFPFVTDLKVFGGDAENDDREILRKFGHYEFSPVFTHRGDTPGDVPFRFQTGLTVRKWPWPTRSGSRVGALQGDIKWVIPGGIGDPMGYLQLWRGYGERLRGYRDFKPLSHRFPFKIKGGIQFKP